MYASTKRIIFLDINTSSISFSITNPNHNFLQIQITIFLKRKSKNFLRYINIKQTSPQKTYIRSNIIVLHIYYTAYERARPTRLYSYMKRLRFYADQEEKTHLGHRYPTGTGGKWIESVLNINKLKETDVKSVDLAAGSSEERCFGVGVGNCMVVAAYGEMLMVLMFVLVYAVLWACVVRLG